jgi:hypothetical protein
MLGFVEWLVHYPLVTPVRRWYSSGQQVDVFINGALCVMQGFAKMPRPRKALS